ncbi:MAG: glycerol-3-phosphate acyltransferase [bacterium]|nr:glycerol-3-phosphate acyltransferase [bacterium]
MTDYHFRALFVVVVCYLLGSIPTAYLIGRLKKIDIFAVGSGNMGATNVSRTLGTGWGLFVWFCDSLKGILAILLARLLMPDSTAAATTIAAISVIVGHNWSLFATLLTGTLRGGKGAATALGTMIIIAPIYVVVATTVLGGLIVARTRYVSLGVLTTFALAMLWIIVRIVQRQEPWEYIFYSLSVVALLLLRFRENIQRLLAGTERRLGERA